MLYHLLLPTAAGLVLLAPLLGAPRPGTTRQQPLLRGGLLAAAGAAAAWMVAQYSLLLPWVQVGSALMRLDVMHSAAINL